MDDMIKKKLVVLLVALPAVVFGHSKGGGITPMHKFFQKYTDSTIIVEYGNLSYGPSYYRILTKTGDFINAFKYEPLDTTYYPIFKLKKDMPVVLWNLFTGKRNEFRHTPADINIFFNPVQLEPKQTKKIWQELITLKPWKLIDDYTYGARCKGVQETITMDSGPWIIHLITKKEIKTLYYLAPEYFEKLCPGNKNRQAAIRIEALFNEWYPAFTLLGY